MASTARRTGRVNNSLSADPVDESVGPVPEDNQPGHHPVVEQDKPTGPPPRPRSYGHDDRHYGFVFEPLVAPLSAMFAVTPWTASVRVGEEDLEVRFGPWRLRTELANVESVEVTGPYAWPKVVGPPHLSLADRGLTFATATKQGVCLRFREPVPGIEPTGHIRHPGLTLTVAEPDEFAAVVEERAALAAARAA